VLRSHHSLTPGAVDDPDKTSRVVREDLHATIGAVVIEAHIVSGNASPGTGAVPSFTPRAEPIQPSRAMGILRSRTDGLANRSSTTHK